MRIFSPSAVFAVRSWMLLISARIMAPLYARVCIVSRFFLGHFRSPWLSAIHRKPDSMGIMRGFIQRRRA
jgi:hypothetical protein